VIVVVGSLRTRAQRCLDALIPQATASVEILIADVAPSDQAAFPDPVPEAVRILRLPPDTTFAAARTAGVRAARGRVVAFLEEHAYPLEGYVQAILEAHRGPHAGISGEIEIANPGVGHSTIIGLMSYGIFLSPQRRREADLIAGHNASYKRDALLALGADLDRLMICDLVLMTRLRRNGHRLLIDPAIRVAHASENTRASICRGFFLHHRTYGPLRAREGGWPWWRRLVYILAAPIVPLYFVAWFRRFLRGHRPDLLPAFDRSLLTVVLVQLAGACGQAVGLLVGPGRAEAQFTVYELTEPRRQEAAA
jgi:glycosyltransferase involved in cell wall biosynthesis